MDYILSQRNQLKVIVKRFKMYEIVDKIKNIFSYLIEFKKINFEIDIKIIN